jgi:putative mRNA 3-end processing factor
VADLLIPDARGLYCAPGGFHVDPWRPGIGEVPLAIITHAHGDHARPGCGRYICAAPGAGVLRRRLATASAAGSTPVIDSVAYGEPFRLGSVTVSLHPAGHVLGSAQVRIESGDEVWVFSGDYKRQSDPTCAGFEPVACDVFITESTFGLPIYRWHPAREAAREIHQWWQQNAGQQRASVLFAYTLGKAQRVMAELALLHRSLGLPEPTVHVHGAVEPLIEAYRVSGVALPPARRIGEDDGQGRHPRASPRYGGELVLAPPAAGGTPWMRRFGAGRDFETAFISGWMRIRGIRRRRGYDRGFVLSDHADWDDLLRTIAETGARRVLVTHGYSEALARFLRGQGLQAEVLPTGYEAEGED